VVFSGPGPPAHVGFFRTRRGATTVVFSGPDGDRARILRFDPDRRNYRSRTNMSFRRCFTQHSVAHECVEGGCPLRNYRARKNVAPSGMFHATILRRRFVAPDGVVCATIVRARMLLKPRPMRNYRARTNITFRPHLAQLSCAHEYYVSTTICATIVRGWARPVLTW
jgi:hypothetical protein